jgi:hypothetical protein
MDLNEKQFLNESQEVDIIPVNICTEKGSIVDNMITFSIIPFSKDLYIYNEIITGLSRKYDCDIYSNSGTNDDFLPRLKPGVSLIDGSRS